MLVSSKYLLVFLGSALVGLILVLSYYIQPIETVATVEFPAEYMRGATITSFDIHGARVYQLQAQDWFFYPYRGHSVFTALELQYMHEQQSWHVQAHKGDVQHTHLSGPFHKISFSDDVRLTRYIGSRQVDLTLQTTFLEYYPMEQICETDRFVKISRPGMHMTGTGLLGSFRHQYLSLLADVVTTYEDSQIFNRTFPLSESNSTPTDHSLRTHEVR